jgi:hypothetical protein
MHVGVYPAETLTRDAIAARIMGPPEQALDLETELANEHLASGAIHAATVAILRPIFLSAVPPQYGVFALARAKLAMLNMNTDGLASTYCRQHAVVNLHGTSLSAEERVALGWERLIDTLQEHPNVRAPTIPGLVLPQAEPLELARSPSFARARALLAVASRLAIVGYSFGAGDDWIVSRMVINRMRAAPLALVVVSPDPVILATQLSDQGKRDVVALSAYWGELAEAILLSVAANCFKSCVPGRLCARCVDYLYQGLLGQQSSSQLHAIS